MSDGPFSVFLIPLAGLAVAAIAIVAGAWNQAHARRLRADQRMALLSRGLAPAEIEALLKSTDDAELRRGKDPMASLGTARRTAVVLIATALGLILFFVALGLILGVRPVLAGAAAGLIPLAIGVGFLFDYQMQKRDMERFGLEIAAQEGKR